MSYMAIIFGGIIGLGLSFLPTILAYLRGNTYKTQTLKYQIIVLVLGVIVSIISGVFSLLIPAFGAIISGAWSLASLAAWIYILINAVKNTKMTVLSKFGINL